MPRSGQSSSDLQSSKAPVPGALEAPKPPVSPPCTVRGVGEAGACAHSLPAEQRLQLFPEQLPIPLNSN